MIYGREIVANTISATRIPDRSGAPWEWHYHSRTDIHSKVACWAIVFDLLHHCDFLREHDRMGKVFFAINHVMRDYRMNRKKTLDLVICTAESDSSVATEDFHELRDRYKIVLNSRQEEFLRHD